MRKSIRVLTALDREASEDLLGRAFGSARGFVVQTQGRLWTSTDDAYTNLGVFHDDVLVSCMRVESVLSEPELNLKLMTQRPLPAFTFPSMYLTKAGTEPSLKTKGLNSLLRWVALKIALQWKARYVFGTMVEGSPRVFTLTQMGYEFLPNPQKWAGSFTSDKVPLIAYLDLQTRGEQAFRYLESQIGSQLKDYDLNLRWEEVPLLPKIKIHWPWGA